MHNIVTTLFLENVAALIKNFIFIISNSHKSKVSSTGFIDHDALVTAAKIGGRIFGLSPEIPGTLKSLGFDGMVTEPSDTDLETMLDAGVITPYYDSDLGYFAMSQAVNSLQKNTDKIKDYKNKIDDLEAKFKKNGKLSPDEENRLELYKLELDILEEQNKELQKRTDTQFSAGKKQVQTDAQGNQTTIYASDKAVNQYKARIKSVEQLTNKIAEAEQKQKDALTETDKQFWKDKEKEYRKDLDSTNKKLKSDEANIRKLKAEYDDYWEGREDDMSDEDKKQSDILS